MTLNEKMLEDLRMEGYETELILYGENNCHQYYIISKTGYRYKTRVSTIDEVGAFLKGVQMGAAC